MSRRTERVGNLIRNTLGQLLLAKMSDPRFDPGRTSITRVDVPEDLLKAKVYVSVHGDEAMASRTLAALQGAAGYLQDRMMRQIQLRNTPKLEFVLDTKFKKTLETLTVISEAMAEIREKDEQRHAQDAETHSTGPDSPGGEE